MSEKLKNNELKDVLNPRNTPQLGFQSYEMLKGDGANRTRQKADFISNESINPTLDYPFLDTEQLNSDIKALERILTLADSLPEPQRTAVWDSTAYRMAEMYWLVGMHKLNDAYADGNTELVTTIIPQLQELNEQLYGKPNNETGLQINGEIAEQIKDKEFTENGQAILDELQSGFSVTIGDDEIDVPAYKISEGERLPAITKEVLTRLGDKVRTDFAKELDIVKTYYEEVILSRPESEREFDVSDIQAIFEAVHSISDPDNISGVEIILDPNASALSWDTSRMAVIVGGRRAPILSLEEMQGKVLHEYCVHGGRAIFGSATDVPVLGTGVYTDADPGEQSDYLSFEEGLATISEKSLNPSKLNNWTPLDMERELAVSLAYNGYDFRQNFETLWRIWVLLSAKDGIDISEKDIDTAKQKTYDICLRIYRSTPTQMPRIDSDGNPIVLTYNKDLAYLTGRIIALDFIDSASDEELDLSFKAKIDPTNHRQLELAKAIMLEK